jgi:hypothetical protein
MAGATFITFMPLSMSRNNTTNPQTILPAQSIFVDTRAD